MNVEDTPSTPEPKVAEKSAPGIEKEFERKPYHHGGFIFLGATIFIVVGAILIWNVPQLFLEKWLPGVKPEESAKQVGVAAQVVLWCLGGVIAVVGVGLSLLKFREEKLAAVQRRREHYHNVERLELERSKERSRVTELGEQRRIDGIAVLRTRFVSAVDLISAEEPTKRTAGMYALAALADDWLAVEESDEAQTCIDVMCGYLRAPVVGRESSTEVQAEHEVRRTGFKLIEVHLQPGSKRPQWGRFTFDLSGISLNGDFEITLNDIRLSGGRIDFSRARLNGSSKINMHEVELSMASVSFARIALREKSGMFVSGVKISPYGNIMLLQATFADDSRVDFSHFDLSEASGIYLVESEIRGNSRFTIRGNKYTAEKAIALWGTSVEDTAVLTLPGGRVRPTGVNVLVRDVRDNFESLSREFEIDLDGNKKPFGTFGPGVSYQQYLPGQEPPEDPFHDLWHGLTSREVETESPVDGEGS